jgi:hypothetical protein
MRIAGGENRTQPLAMQIDSACGSQDCRTPGNVSAGLRRDRLAVAQGNQNGGLERRTPLRREGCGAPGGSGWPFGVYAAELLEAGSLLRGAAAIDRRSHARKFFRYSFLLSSGFLLPGLFFSAVFSCIRSNCRAPAKRHGCKLHIFLVLQKPPRKSLRQRGTLCLRGTSLRS